MLVGEVSGECLERVIQSSEYKYHMKKSHIQGCQDLDFIQKLRRYLHPNIRTIFHITQI